MIVLLGESGSGKSTLEKMLCEKYEINKIVTYTTRPIRCGEKDGIDYNFITQKKFKNKISNNEFAEYFKSENGWYYGMDKNDCIDNSICVITPSGLRKLRDAQNDKFNGLDITSIYIKTHLEKRMKRILDRGDSNSEISRRFKTDVVDFQDIESQIDVVVNNDGSIEECFLRLEYALYGVGLRFELKGW